MINQALSYDSSIRSKVRILSQHLQFCTHPRIRNIIDPPIHSSKHLNVFHCTTQKAGSQWVRLILSDIRLYAHSGLTPMHYEASLPEGYDPRRLTERYITRPFLKRTILTPFYIDYKGYKLTPKPNESAAIFVLRDPRDLVISHYFSMRYSHGALGGIVNYRRELEALSEPEGMLQTLEYLHSYGTFLCQSSWLNQSGSDTTVLIVRFEDLIGSHSLPLWERVCHHLDIQIPMPILSQVLQDHSFEILSGRRPGVEDKHAHYRKGIPGDWKSYFDEQLIERFKQLTGDLVVKAGYETEESW